MYIQISQELAKVFENNKKDYNRSLDFLAASVDDSALIEAFNILKVFSLQGDKTEIEVDDSTISNIMKTFKPTIKKSFFKKEKANEEPLIKLDSDLIEKMLWVSVLFPEI